MFYRSNPKHTPGYSGGNGNLPAGIEPINSLKLFEDSKPLGDKRFSIDSEGDIHQFTNSRDNWHWAGGSADVRSPLILDNKTKAKLQSLFPEHANNPRLN